MISELDAVLFDLDDTLHDDTQSYRLAAQCVARDLGHEHPIDAELFWQTYVAEGDAHLSDLHVRSRILDLSKRMMRAALRSADIRDASLGRRVADAFERYRREHLKLFPGTIELLASLREREIKLGLVTNGFSDTHRDKISFLGLDDLFDGIFIADEVGMFKPDPRIFIYACEHLGVKPSRTAIVGDRLERDILGGQAAGLAGIWFNVRNEHIPNGEIRPDGSVTTIAELTDFLASAGGRKPL